MFTNQITRDLPGRRFTVTVTTAGWAVREERDSHIVRTITYTDWHRVERAMQRFERAADRPEGSGQPHH